MDVPVYKEQGDRLYMIANNIIVELDLSSYEHGVIGCAVADERISLLGPNEHAKTIKPGRFNKYYKQYQQFLSNAFKNTGGK